MSQVIGFHQSCLIDVHQYSPFGTGPLTTFRHQPPKIRGNYFSRKEIGPIGRPIGPIDILVRMRGLEPPRCHHHRLLRPARLPVPPHPRTEPDLTNAFMECQATPPQSITFVRLRRWVRRSRVSVGSELSRRPRRQLSSRLPSWSLVRFTLRVRARGYATWLSRFGSRP